MTNYYFSSILFASSTHYEVFLLDYFRKEVEGLFILPKCELEGLRSSSCIIGLPSSPEGRLGAFYYFILPPLVSI